VVGGVVIVQPGTPGRSLAGYDRETGELLWLTGPDRGSYGSPVYATLAGVPQVLILNQGSMSGHDPRTGAILWSEEWPGGEPKVATPLVLDDRRVLFSAGYGLGSRMLELAAKGDGTLAVRELWASPRLKSKFANMVLYEGTVYGLDDGILTALDPETGERRWKRGRYGHGQVVLVGDLLLIQTEKGDVVLVEANPDEHIELGRLEALSEKTWNPPALAGRYLLVRNHHEAVCYELPVEG
jgi:outer membrane protein assembly factor BamB